MLHKYIGLRGRAIKPIFGQAYILCERYLDFLSDKFPIENWAVENLNRKPQLRKRTRLKGNMTRQDFQEFALQPERTPLKYTNK